MGKWASFTNFWRATGQSNLADRIEGCSTGQSAVVYEYETQAFVPASVCIQVWLSSGPPGFASCSGYCAGLINPHKVDVKLKASDVFKETRHVKQLILNPENTKTLTVINRTNSRHNRQIRKSWRYSKSSLTYRYCWIAHRKRWSGARHAVRSEVTAICMKTNFSILGNGN